jgi:hypothetical protein
VNEIAKGRDWLSKTVTLFSGYECDPGITSEKLNEWAPENIDASFFAIP